MARTKSGRKTVSQDDLEVEWNTVITRLEKFLGELKAGKTIPCTRVSRKPVKPPRLWGNHPPDWAVALIDQDVAMNFMYRVDQFTDRLDEEVTKDRRSTSPTPTYACLQHRENVLKRSRRLRDALREFIYDLWPDLGP